MSTQALLERHADEVTSWREPASGRELPQVAPDSEAACAELLTLAQREGLALIPLGLGSKVGWTCAAERADFALSTRRLSGVVAYEPGDGTVTVRAGTTVADLAATVEAGGHRLTPDVPRPESATVGGVIAAGQSGVDRLRFGPVRNHVLGLAVLRADGARAQSGSRLVKNVTGYDLHRLYTGSHGTLALVVEASLRLFPSPPAELVVRGRARSLEAARAALDAVHALPLAFETLACEGRSEGLEVIAVLSGRSELLEPRSSEVEAAFAPLDEVIVRTGEEAGAARRAFRDGELEDGWPHLRLLSRPSESVREAELLLGALAELGQDRVRLRLHPQLSTLDLRLEAQSVDERRDLLLELHQAATHEGLRVQWLGARTELPDELETVGPSIPALALMHAIRDSLDPTGVFARGRFHGGL